MNEQGSIHTNSVTPGARRALSGRRVLWLVAPTVIGIGLLVLVLALNVFTVSAFGDLQVTISGLSHDPADPTPVTAGTVYSFTVIITNAGAAGNPPAEAVEFQYRAPEVVVVHISSSVGWCEVGTPGDPDDPSICSLGNMDSGATEIVTIVVYVPSNLAEGMLLDHDVRAWQFGTEEYPPTNEDHGWMGVTTEADLAITKSARGDNVTAYDTALREFTKMQYDDAVTAGELLQYTLIVTNTGPSDAQNVVVTDTLPSGLGDPYVHFVSAELAYCRQDDIDREKLTCYLGTMVVDEVRTFHILVRVDPAVIDGTTITNVATVGSDTDDPVTDNNTATNDTTVNAVADIFVMKVDVPIETRLDQYFEPDNAIAGEEHRYLIAFGNNGPSVARFVGITDALDRKQGIILGETFVRCEPVDPDQLVTCSEAGGIVIVDFLEVGNEAIIPSAGNGTLNPGDQFGFYLITKVDPGYVLDADDTGTEPNLIAENTVGIGSSTTDYRLENNQNTEQTEIIAEADLKVSKTDTPDPTLPDAYLHYDPVTGGFVYTYTLTIENLGPSDAAKVVLYDWPPTDATFRLPPGAIGNQIFYPTDDIQCMLRDDGLLLCLVGNDPNNEGTNQRGRLNVSSVLTMTFSVEVDPSPTPRILENTAWVVAVAEDEYPFALGETSDDPIEPADFQDGRTPTADQDYTNNTYTETTTVLTGRVAVDKKAYVNISEARGIDIPNHPIYGNLTEVERCVALAQDNILVLPGDEIIYCYTITNPGETWLRSITLQDAPNGFEWLDDPADPDDLSNYTVIYPALTTLRGTITLDPAAPAINQTINISQTHNAKAVLAPAGVEDDYLAIMITRRVTVDFPELGPISGVVWEDENGNGVVDLLHSPPPVRPEPLSAAGVDVYLLPESGPGTVLDHTTTDADGRYAFHGVGPGKYIVWVVGQPLSPVIEFDMSKGYSTANFDSLENRWYIESTLPWVEWLGTIFRVLGNNRAVVSALPSTKYSTEYPGVPLVFNSDLLNDTLGLPVLEDSDPQWNIYEDRDGDGLPSPGDVIEYVADIPNSGAIEATGVMFYDWLYNWISDDADDLRVPGWLINGSVSAAIHVYGRDLVTGRVIDADVQPPDLAFGEDLLLRTQAPGIDLTYDSAIVLDEEIVLGNNEGDDEVFVWTRLAIPPKGYLLRFDDVTYDPPIPVTFSLRIKYRVQIKETKYVRLGTIVLNHPWVTYNEIGVFDQRFPNFDPANPDAHTAANKVANNHAGTPGRAWERPEFPGWPTIPVDVEPTNYLGDRFDDYALPGAAARDDDDPTWFKLMREPRRIQLPAIDHEGDWETQIQVQNGGDDNTGAIVFFWGEYSGQCPYSDPGPIGYACKWVAENGLWSLEDQIIPSTAKSAIVYSVDEDLFDDACADAAYVVAEPNPYLDPTPKPLKWRRWEDGDYGDYEGTGEPIAVIVQRQGPNDHGTMVSSAYPGISENNVGGGPEYQYFAPYAMRQYHNLDTEMIIHNSGERCAEVWLEYQKQGDDVFSYEERVTQLAPGESIRKRVPAVLGAEWLGSIYVTANEPLGIVVDQTSFLPSEDQGTLLTYEARPYKLTTDTVFYADLVWREVSGWQSSIQVQNLTQHSQPTFVTVEFFDQSGDSILFLGEWVPRAGGKTFYLPAVTDLGMEYAGAAVIQSHSQVDYPGGLHDGQPIFAVVDLKKTTVYDESLPGWRPTMPGEIQGGAYNALAEGEKKEASAVMLPSLAKSWNDQGVTSLIAVRNNSNCNEIELKLEIRKGSGTVVSYTTDFWLSPGHIKLIDLANLGTVNPGFGGAGMVEVTNVHQLCDTNSDGAKDWTPTMLSVVVVNKAAGPGDITSVYEGIPVAYWGSP